MNQTPLHGLATEYVRLGGQRKSKMDDNATSIRHWHKDTPDAETFWQEKIATLGEEEREQVEKFLPSINAA